MSRFSLGRYILALANKLTRIVWAILPKPGTVYLQSKGAARS
jgi:transposase